MPSLTAEIEASVSTSLARLVVLPEHPRAWPPDAARMIGGQRPRDACTSGDLLRSSFSLAGPATRLVDNGERPPLRVRLQITVRVCRTAM